MVALAIEEVVGWQVANPTTFLLFYPPGALGLLVMVVREIKANASLECGDIVE